MDVKASGPKPNPAPQNVSRGRNRVRVQAQPVAQDNTRVATPTLKADTSAISAKTEKPNPYSSFAKNTAEVKVDGWKKGKNDSLEGILKNQGYSLSEIYSKDANGKSMIDKVAAANDLRNPNVIQPGQKLNVPSKEDSESLSSKDLDAGQRQTASVGTGDVSIDTQMDKDKEGNTTATTTSNAGDASMSSATTVGENGRIDTSVSRDGDAVNAQSVAMNDGAVSQVDTKTTPDSTSTTVKDIDSNRDLSVSADADNVKVSNDGKVDTNIDISEKSSDGFFENMGRGITNWFTGGNDKPEAVDLKGASSVNATKNDEGQATVTARVDGKDKTLLETAGDTDDSWLERAGERTDNFFGAIGDFFTGGNEGTSKSEVTKMTRRGRRPV